MSLTRRRPDSPARPRVNDQMAHKYPDEPSSEVATTAADFAVGDRVVTMPTIRPARYASGSGSGVVANLNLRDDEIGVWLGNDGSDGHRSVTWFRSPEVAVANTATTARQAPVLPPSAVLSTDAGGASAVGASANLLDDALAYAAAGWEIFPLRGKIPAISSRAGGRGLLDATTDQHWLRQHWRAGYNIGARVHPGMIVLDTDPRHGGEDNLVALVSELGELPETLTCFSGRCDGGRHRYLLHPGGALNSKRLPEGVDLKTHSGYVVLPPSRHPDTGRPYQWKDPDVPIAPCPAWLADLLRPAAEEKSKRPFAPRVVHDPESSADWFTASTTWEQVLAPAGWTEVRGGWRHPAATSVLSATIRHDVLFVYSTNTVFEVTEAEVPHGYTRFRAWAVLKFDGDLSAAARAARAMRKGREVAA